MREYYIHIHYLASLKANQIGHLASILCQTVIEHPVRGRNYGYKPTSLPLYPSYSRTKKNSDFKPLSLSVKLKWVGQFKCAK